MHGVPMGAIFGLIGVAPYSELDEMGARLRHRSPFAAWHQIALRVFLGQATSAAGRVSQHYVIDLPATSHYEPHHVARAIREESLDELKGPFAAAVWDDERQCLFLARDFLGLKPLHYCVLPSGGVAFATEYKALLALSEIPARPDRDAIHYLQVYKAVPPSRSLLEGIRVIPPGSVVQFDRSGNIAATRAMSPVRLAVTPMHEKQAAHALLGKLEAAMQPLTSGRAAIGLSLSGGIDSMTVAHLARKCAPRAEIVALTAAQGGRDSEVARAALTAAAVSARHEVIDVPAHDLFSQLATAVWHLENPIGRTETFQFLALAKAARERGLSSLLTGMGADLLFAGMPRHKVLWMAERAPLLRADLLQFYEATQTGYAPSRPLAKLMMWAYYREHLPPAPHVLGTESVEPVELVAAPGPEFLNRCLMLDGPEPTSRTLARIERPLAAYGVEYTSPFLDRDVIDFAFTLPSDLKVRRGVQKYILRYAMRDLMHNSLRRAPKDLMRMNPDYRFNGTLLALARDYLHPERVRRRGLFDSTEVQRIVRACSRGGHPEIAMRLWTLVVTELWAEVFVDGRGRHPYPTAFATPTLNWESAAAASALTAG